ncbi:uncharacterized protein E0L32_010395 [Thyridium curvatum]|uniref:Alpha/beta hydrolase fold-3 domain-containing protein n=1 Tax=Thyridium curvatum TaxID=1093900 RepID=A0A507AUN7_9PEZI|nr:uncharacterized protein E0L32_010395 [Thyridium curvatum]TPX07940.1 hypothetical protein E0L32_010395 [Thyridium curvatum]
MVQLAYQDPATWLELGQPDPILEEIAQGAGKPQLEKRPDISSVVATRAAWAPVFKDFAEAAVARSNGSVTSTDIDIPRRDGGSCRALLYKPEDGKDGGRPLVVFIHGGGFVYGLPEMEAGLAVAAVQEYQCVALCLSYRLAPEHKFPTATDDCWDALKWITQNAARLGVDLSKGFVLGGTSAGGSIVTALSHLARDEKVYPPLTGLYLNVPLLLAPEAVRPEQQPLYRSREQNAYAPVLNKAFMDMYTAACDPDDLQNSYLWSPFNWPGGPGKAHAGLPPTYFQICGLDPLRDEALIYERVLRTEYKTPTRVDIYPGLPHMFVPNFPTHPSSKKYPKDALRGIGWLLNKGEQDTV